MYGAGNNQRGQLGISNEENQLSPTRISALNDKRIVDIQPGFGCTLALSDPGCVYSAGRAGKVFDGPHCDGYGECGHGGASKSGWNLISALRRTKILQIVAGSGFSMFLDCDGVVFSCGYNKQGQLGLGHKRMDKTMLPTAISVFKDQNVKISKIAAGCQYSLAMDSEYRAYAWGSNYFGQCGVDGDRGHRYT